MSLTIQRTDETSLLRGEDVKIEASICNKGVKLNIEANTETALSKDEFLKVVREIQHLKKADAIPI